VSDVFSEWREDAVEVPWVEVDSEDLTAMFDVIEVAQSYLDAPRGSPSGGGLGRARMRERLARVYDLIGDDDE